MVCSGIMEALSRMMREALKVAEERKIPLKEALNIVMSEDYKPSGE